MDKIHITLEEGQKLYFTSDLHFGHKNVLTFCDRPFSDVKEMGRKLIENWNNVVSNNDTAFILGDLFWFNDSHSIKKVLGELQGKDIYIIAGNHDDFKSYHRVVDERIHLLGDTVEIWVAGLYVGKPSKQEEIFLSHCPVMTWPHRCRGVVNLFGHIHSGPRTKAEEDQGLPLWEGQQYDVGVDNNEYTPIEIHEIYQKLGRKFQD